MRRGEVDLETALDALREAGVRVSDAPSERALETDTERGVSRGRDGDGRGPGELGRRASVHGS